MKEIIQSIDPAHGDIVGEVSMTAVEEIPAVVARARAAQGAWSAMGARARAAIARDRVRPGAAFARAPGPEMAGH